MFSLFNLMENLSMRYLAWKGKSAGQSGFMVITFLVLIITTPAFGMLKRVGPTDRINGFPQWYEDTSGLMLEPCLDPVYCKVQTADPALPISFPDNFPGFFSYWSASATIPFNGSDPLGAQTSATLSLGVTGYFINGTVDPHFQEVSSGISFSVSGLWPGAVYRVTHPYGSFTVLTDTSGAASYSRSSQIGNLSTSFSDTLSGPIGPFLVWDETQAVLDPNTGQFRFAPPAGFVGDPSVPHPVKGSPFSTNYFQVTGPGLVPKGIQTHLFSTKGKAFSGPVLSNIKVRRATYARPLSGPIEAEVFIEGDPAASNLVISSRGGSTSPLLGPVFLEPTAEAGLFHAKLDLNTDLGGGLATGFSVIDQPAGAAPGEYAIVSGTLVDEVVITEASYDTATGRLTVRAYSRDEAASPGLIVPELPPPSNVLDASGSLSLLLTAPPEKVTVQSGMGGESSARVTLTGPGSTDVGILPPPVAIATGPSGTPFPGIGVQLSASQSTGIITRYSWTTLVPDADGNPIPLINATTAAPSFIFPVTLNPPREVVVQLTVEGPGGVDSSNLFISPPPIDIFRTIFFDQAQLKMSKWEWKISGTMSPFVAGTTTVDLIIVSLFPSATETILATGIPVDASGGFQFSQKDLPLPNGTLGFIHVIARASNGRESGPFPVQVQ